MLSYERLQEAYGSYGGSITGGKRRQVFITKSRTLAGMVEKYFTSLLRSMSFTSSNDMLDAVTRQRSNSMAPNDELFFSDDSVDIDDYRPDLPKKFSELEDKHFPLFLTFDKVNLSSFAYALSDIVEYSSTACWKTTMGCHFLNV